MRESTIRVAVLTISDSVVAGTREDLSGPEIQKQCEKLGWSVVQSATVPDEVEAIAQRLEGWVEEEAATLILTTGGTGIALRDVTPEATRRVIERRDTRPRRTNADGGDWNKLNLLRCQGQSWGAGSER